MLLTIARLFYQQRTSSSLTSLKPSTAFVTIVQRNHAHELQAAQILEIFYQTGKTPEQSAQKLSKVQALG